MYPVLRPLLSIKRYSRPMKNVKLATVALILMIMTTTALSSKAQKHPKGQAIKAVEATVEHLRTLMLTPDSAKLSALASDKLTYGHSGGKIQNKQEFIHSFTNGESVFTSLSFSDQTVTLSGNTAIVRHTLAGGTNDKGKGPGNVKLLILLVLKKQKESGWVLLARQAVKFPEPAK
jgi:ketosteroid isomerase-like protein